MNASKKANDASEAQALRAKAQWARIETLKINKVAPETRIASSLSNVEILVALFYGGVLRFSARERYWPERDRFVISKGHGSIAMYPILADLEFFPAAELKRVCVEGSMLGGIPDPIVPGYETINGSLGHGLGVACGMAVALKTRRHASQVFVLTGDGELNEGSIWEALMFAAHHQLDNLNIIVDKNQKCMLDYTSKVINMDPLAERFLAFGCDVSSVDGHDVVAVQNSLHTMKSKHVGKPKVLLAETIKGKGSAKLEANPLCHVAALTAAEIDEAIARLIHG